VIHALLAVVGAAASITEAIRDLAPHWPTGEELVARGTRRWQWWLRQPKVADTRDRLATWARGFYQQLQADIDEVSDLGEELLAHAELLRWRIRRIPQRALATAFRRLRELLDQVGGPVTSAIRQPPHSGS
jgi:hypothetical protein